MLWQSLDAGSRVGKPHPATHGRVVLCRRVGSDRGASRATSQLRLGSASCCPTWTATPRRWLSRTSCCTVSRGSLAGATRSAIDHRVSPGPTTACAGGAAGAEVAADVVTRPREKATSRRTEIRSSMASRPRAVRRGRCRPPRPDATGLASPRRERCSATADGAERAVRSRSPVAGRQPALRTASDSGFVAAHARRVATDGADVLVMRSLPLTTPRTHVRSNA